MKHVVVVASRECEFAEAPVHKGAAVADLGQRVHGGRLVEFPVKSLFAGVLEVDFQHVLAQLEPIVGIQDHLGNLVSVYESAVGTSQILDGDVLAVEGQAAVLAAYQLVVQADVGVLASAENDRTLFEGNLLELGLGVQDYQVRVQFQRPEGDGIARRDYGLVQILHFFSNFSNNITNSGPNVILGNM